MEATDAVKQETHTASKSSTTEAASKLVGQLASHQVTKTSFVLSHHTALALLFTIRSNTEGFDSREDVRPQKLKNTTRPRLAHFYIGSPEAGAPWWSLQLLHVCFHCKQFLSFSITCIFKFIMFNVQYPLLPKTLAHPSLNILKLFA